jgi:hypothetical protein
VPAFERATVPNPNANSANTITKHFFPIIEEFLPLFRRIEPDDEREVSEEIVCHRIAEKLTEEG